MSELKIIGHVRTDFPTKFGIPRQSGVVKGLVGHIVFEPEYRNPDMLRGLEDFSHIWILWQFSENLCENGEAKWSPTVRPPRLGGNKRLGVFATRSPFRPNPIGLSAVKIEKIVPSTSEGPVIEISGADMMDGTPVFDIKPYIPYADAYPEALGGFTDSTEFRHLEVDMNPETEQFLKKEGKLDAVKGILENDPRPHYQNEPDRVYGMVFAGLEVKFCVNDGCAHILSVTGGEGKSQ